MCVQIADAVLMRTTTIENYALHSSRSSIDLTVEYLERVLMPALLDINAKILSSVVANDDRCEGGDVSDMAMALNEAKRCHDMLIAMQKHSKRDRVTNVVRESQQNFIKSLILIESTDSCTDLKNAEMRFCKDTVTRFKKRGDEKDAIGEICAMLRTV